jgi:hypothetical protein
MPIEIRELVIKATIGEESTNTGNNGNGSGGGGEVANQDAIVKACVERVLEIMKQKQER